MSSRSTDFNFYLHSKHHIYCFSFAELITPVMLSFFCYKMETVIYNLQSFEDGLNEPIHANAHGKHIMLMSFPLHLRHNLVWE